MKTFRKVLFWMHLTAGATAGVIIFIMCVTGALLAFERQLIELSEDDARHVLVQDGAAKLTPQQIIEKVRESRPEAKPSAMSITNEAGAAWLISLGREGQVYVDPYTGAIAEGNKSVRGLMSELRNWHRYVALSGDGRPVGKGITGASNLLFLFLAISGIYIWFPRNVTWKSIKPVLWFKRGLSGKARNFNWHNTIGFWTSLFLIVFTLTATVISYQWASNLLYTLTGNDVPPQQQQQGGGQGQEKPYEFPSNITPAWTTAEVQSPTWRSISLRLPIEKEAAVFTIDEGIYWNIFGRSTLTVEAATGATTKWEPYGGQNSGRQLRSWFRFTHTGETGGIVGQIIGFIACVGGAFLVWTGFSLALRRFRNWRAARV
ncbi:MAG TPA: PepSY-associated TM helix domain-containing protein [Pyrinomonadaceae bacterium]|nr:PepSY-associated TM helix domain-containing protein [Pyrinomonadaceae bacterium]